MDRRIEGYFGKTLTLEERSLFEKEMRENGSLAEEVAFYLATRKAQIEGREKLLKERHADWQILLEENSTDLSAGPRRQGFSWWMAAAAVALLAVGLVWILKSGSPSYEQLAQEYVATEFETLNVQMSGNVDSLQIAVRLFNGGDFAGARQITENLLVKSPENAEVKKLAGIVSLRLKQYDKAIEHFRGLGAREDLFSNPGKFYEALALLERGNAGDKERAEGLLKEVVEKRLEGKEVVEKWRR